MHKKFLFLIIVLFISLFFTSCKSKLPVYQLDEMDNRPISFEVKDNKPLYHTTKYSDRSIITSYVRDDSYDNTSPSNTYILVLDAEIPNLSHPRPPAPLSYMYYEYNNDDYLPFYKIFFAVRDEKIGYDKIISFFQRITCNNKKGQSISNSMTCIFVSIPFVTDDNSINITYEHFRLDNSYETVIPSTKLYESLHYHDYSFVTNIYNNGTIIGKLVYSAYRHKPQSEYIESLFNNNSKIISIEDLYASFVSKKSEISSDN